MSKARNLSKIIVDTSGVVSRDSLDVEAVAKSGSYTDLINKPTIPAAQVNSDWNASSGVAQILNKPSLATVATSGAYSDLTGTPTITTIPSQTGNSGKYLTTNGTDTSWANVDALPSQTGNNGKYLTTNGSTASWATINVTPALDDLSDVTITTPSSGQVLKYNGSGWVNSTVSSNTTPNGLYEHANTISANYSITSGNNAMSAGTMTVNSGVVVTVPSGSTWVIV